MELTALLLVGGTILFLLGYVFSPVLGYILSVLLSALSSLLRSVRAAGGEGTSSAEPMAYPKVGERRMRRRGGIAARDVMAIFFSLLFGLWALYVLTSHPDSIVQGPRYDSATKQAATGVIGAISGLWIGRAAE